MAVIKILDANEFARKLKPITSTQMKLRSGEFDENGLFSEVIFGAEGSIDRTMRMSYIDLNAEVIHPTLYRVIIRLDRRLEKMFFAETSFSLDSSGKLIEDENGVVGILGFKSLMPKLKFRGETQQREELIKLINFNYQKDTLFVSKLPVIPPDFRPYFEDEQTGEITYDELNEIYVDVLRKSFQIKSINKTTAFYSVLNANLQKAVNTHDAFIQKKIEKKRGLIRNSILGKRVDFSGRAVITSGPELDAHEIGIPLKMAVMIFSPFLIHLLIFSQTYPRREELRNEISQYIPDGELSVDTIQKLFRAIESGDKIPRTLFDLIFEAAEIVSRNRFVLAKRDPVIHELGYRGFKVKIVRGETIHLSSLHTGGFNADYDGDQMAVYHPITNQAQEEIKQKMMRATGTKNFNSVIYELSKDMLVGIYCITKPRSENNSPSEVSEEELEKATNPYIAVMYKGKKTTMGKAIFNNALPKDFPFVDDLVTKKIVVALIQKILKNYGPEASDRTISKLKTIGFKFATIMAPTLDISNIQMPPEIQKIKQRIKNASPEEAFKLLQQAADIMKKHLENTGVYDLSASGATKGWDQLQQMFIAKGVISDTEGNVLDPIAGSYADGLSPTEFFKVGSGARKGVVDRALNTSDTGYFTRQLVYVLNSVEAHPSLLDCKTKRSITIRLTKDIIDRLSGRNVIRGSKAIPFNKSDYSVGQTASLRTPIYCESPKICHTCYGDLLKIHKTPYIGVVSGMAIGERGTQLIMRCSDGLVHHNGNLIPFVDLFEMGENYRKEGDIETVEFNDYINGKNGPVKASTIQRHEPHDRMLFIKTKSGHSIICQANHPLWIKKNSIHPKYDNKYCRLIGENQYTEIMSTRKLFTTDGELKEVTASDIKKYDAIWIDNSDAINNGNSIIPDISGYVAGIYCAEGCKVYNNRDKKAIMISQNTEGPIKERIFEECKIAGFDKVTKTKQGITCWENHRRVNEVILGEYAWEKRLKHNFINYDKQWLKDFISGLADGDGSVFNFRGTSTCIRIYTTSYYLVNQLHAICLKLGYKFNVCKAKYSEKYKRTRLSFSCDIRFLENPNLNSEKFKSVVFTPVTLRKENIIKGFDPIMTIKEIESDAWRYPVYDIKTETNEYLLNFIQNHNTFHKGGAATAASHNIIQEIIDGDSMVDDKKVPQYLNQAENLLVTKKSCRITLDMDNYEINNNIKIRDDEKIVWVSSLLAQIEFSDFAFNIILDYPVELMIFKMQKVGKEKIILEYPANENILNVPFTTVEIKAQINYVSRLLGGKEIKRDPEHLLKRLYDVYLQHTDMDLVHFEVLISQVLRDKNNQAIPARLGKKWDPVMMNIKQNVFNTSFVQGLAFENVRKAIEVGLTTSKSSESSILEKIIKGELIDTKKGRKR